MWVDLITSSWFHRMIAKTPTIFFCSTIFLSLRHNFIDYWIISRHAFVSFLLIWKVINYLQVGDLSIHESVATFTALLIARSCFSLEDVIYHVALPSLLAALPSGELPHVIFSLQTIVHVAYRYLVGLFVYRILEPPDALKAGHTIPRVGWWRAHRASA